MSPICAHLCSSVATFLRSRFLAARFETAEPWYSHLARFARELVDDRIGTTDLVVLAAILLGVTCGVLGCFLILRRQSLLGDAVGHAVLPGVFLGFLAAGARSTPALLLGALVAGLLAAALIAVLQRTTQLKAGECIGVVFTGFYGLGILLLKHIQNNAARYPGQAGLDKFLFGQIAGISATDVIYMAVVAAVSLACVALAWRSLAAWAFDEGFAVSIGLPVKAIETMMTGLVTVAIVISIQAVGVVLVAAMLVTPAATAYLLTDRLHRMVLLAAMFGAAAGVIGAVVSLLGADMPTGSLMVIAGGTLFGLAFLLSPRHGLLPRLRRVWERRRRTQAENLLRMLYLIMESRAGGGKVPDNADRRFGVSDAAGARGTTPAAVRKYWRLAAHRGWVDPSSPDPMILTDAGFAEARHVVRTHRLWELFLTQEAKIASDHVHADAEDIEHILPRDVLAKLEHMLDYPTADPHGKPIP
ncbi:metal ABC transporter permease [Humisphaera borealis]|uniref:Metal ABC transporter permease n=1 Tax=Humisphaera borealis TaxID=2807512 RepID=A0A7M2WPV9_9BACT|nr:metal ABC transporter permease [Humisphaera borealis]QOV87508.1 metal ABC transporter permease [Humisphaera borealis]